jgi:hypothetical protein
MKRVARGDRRSDELPKGMIRLRLKLQERDTIAMLMGRGYLASNRKPTKADVVAAASRLLEDWAKDVLAGLDPYARIKPLVRSPGTAAAVAHQSWSDTRRRDAGHRQRHVP